MARPRTTVGTYGKITTTAYVDASRKVKAPKGARPKAAVWVSRTRFRDRDGVSRMVEVSASTKAKAESGLKARLADRLHTATSGVMKEGMTVGSAAAYWLRTLDGQQLSDGTIKLYNGNVTRYIKGSDIEHLTLMEVNNVGTLERWLKTIADTNGDAAAKGARSVLSGTLRLAVRYGVLPHNALQDAKTPRATDAKEAKRDPDRAFTEDELSGVRAHVDKNPNALKLDTADLIHFLAGTGVRINEALTLRWEDVDLKTGEVHIRGTKTEFSDRHLHLPPWLTARLNERLDKLKAIDQDQDTTLAGTGVVFHSPGTLDREKPRNTYNTIKLVSRALDSAGFPWATSHTFRHTVITRIVEAGHDIGLAADQAGHSDLRTTAAYIGRKRSTKAVADVL